jgi:hypothetical protein
MQFKSAVFEKLLFPLHGKAYQQIQACFEDIEKKHPGTLAGILANYRNSSDSSTLQPEWRPGKENEVKYPTINITIKFSPTTDLKMSTLYKSTDFRIEFDYQEKPAPEYQGNHLIVGYYRNGVLNTFIIPVEYVLGFNEKNVMKADSYQLYSHTLLSKQYAQTITENIIDATSNRQSNQKTKIQKFYQDNAYIYIGITKRTWQTRFRQHWNDSTRGSNLRFHRALRGEIIEIGTIEHIVERAGLTEDQALTLEEREVEARSLYPLHEQGLNMIPGGRAGLHYIHAFIQRTGYTHKKEVSADTLESILVEVQKANLIKIFSSSDPQKINAELVRLWREDMDFRIKATTGQHNRFSYKQIKAARLWHASGWSNDKILENLLKIDNKDISIDQLVQLLKGETYAEIPDVLFSSEQNLK